MDDILGTGSPDPMPAKGDTRVWRTVDSHQGRSGGMPPSPVRDCDGLRHKVSRMENKYNREKKEKVKKAEESPNNDSIKLHHSETLRGKLSVRIIAMHLLRTRLTTPSSFRTTHLFYLQRHTEPSTHELDPAHVNHATMGLPRAPSTAHTVEDRRGE